MNAGNIDVDVGDVLDYSQYVSIDPSVNMFKVARSGLVQNDTIVYKGTASFDFSVKMKEGICTIAPSLESIGFNVLLEDDGTFGLISNTYLGSSPSVICSCEGSGTISSQTSNLSGKIINTSFVYSDSMLSTIDTLNFNLSYGFDFSSFEKSFTNDIYNKMNDTNSFAFSFKVEVNV